MENPYGKGTKIRPWNCTNYLDIPRKWDDRLFNCIGTKGHD